MRVSLISIISPLSGRRLSPVAGWAGEPGPACAAGPSVPNAEHEHGLESDTVEIELRGAKVIGYCRACPLC